MVPSGPPQVEPCHVGPGASPPVVRTLRGRASEAASGRSAPGGMPAGGLHFSCEKWRKEHQGLCPWTPFFKTARCSLAPSFGIAAQRNGSGFYRDPPTCPDLGTFFWGIFFGWIFSTEQYPAKDFFRICVSKSGLVYFCQKEIAPTATNPKEEASSSERFYSGGAGASPLRLFASGLSHRESLDPRPG